MLDLGVDLDVWPWVWLFIAVTFIVIEVTILGGSFVLLPFGVSAFVAALLGFYDVAIEIQWGTFLVGGAVIWVGFYRWAKKFLRDHVLPPGVGAERLVGLLGTVTEQIDPDDPNRRGRITIEGEVWGALAQDDASLPAGTRIRVTSMQGARVIVQRVANQGGPTQ